MGVDVCNLTDKGIKTITFRADFYRKDDPDVLAIEYGGIANNIKVGKCYTFFWQINPYATNRSELDLFDVYIYPIYIEFDNGYSVKVPYRSISTSGELIIKKEVKGGK